MHLEGLQVLSDPMEFARSSYENGDDQPIYYAIVASLYQENSIFGMGRKQFAVFPLLSRWLAGCGC